MKQIKLFITLLLVAFSYISLNAQSIKDDNYYYKKGIELLDSNFNKDAIAMFDTAIILNPKSVNAYAKRGKAKVKYFSPYDGINDYDTAIQLADYKDKLAFFEMKEEELVGKQIPPVSIRMSPTNGMVYNSKTYGGYWGIYPTMGLKGLLPEKDVEKVFTTAINLFPDSAKAYFDRANYYVKINKKDEAIEDVYKAVKLAPLPFYFYTLVCYLVNQNEVSEKRITKLLDECIKLNPNDEWSYYYKALIFQTLRKNKEALDNFNVAIKMTPNPIFYINRAQVKAQLPNDYTSEDILNDYLNSLALTPEKQTNSCKNIYTHIANQYGTMKMYDSAIKYQALAIECNKPIFYKYVNSANFKDLSGTYSKGDIIEDLKKAKVLFEKSKSGIYVNYHTFLYKKLIAKYPFPNDRINLSQE